MSNKKSKLLLLVTLLCFFAVLCSGCGSSGQVPDSVIERCINDSGMPSEGYTWSATHNVDSSAHTDDVEITVVVEFPYATSTLSQHVVFQYNKASDLWTPLDHFDTRELYDDKNQELNGKLKGDWHLTNGRDTYDITVESVSAHEMTVSYSLEIDPWIGPACHVEGTETCKFEPGGFTIPIKLPGSYYVPDFFLNDNDLSFVDAKTTALHIGLDSQVGLHAHIKPEIRYSGN